MVTLQSIGGCVNNPAHMEIYGLSTDVKPLKTFENKPIVNASLFIEMDTSSGFLYDEENHRWLPQ